MAKHKPQQAAGQASDEATARTAETPEGTAKGTAAETPPVEAATAGSNSIASPAAAPPAAEASAAVEQQQPSPAEQIARLGDELAAMKDRTLRYQAELDNYRKRAQRQIEEERRYANLPLLRDLLPVFDNVHRAIEAAEKSPEPASLLAGFKLVAQQLQDVLTRYHCVAIDALHAPFDPHLHQAIAQQPSQEHPASTVVSVAQTGFQLHDRVVRPSQVIVSTMNHTNQ